MMTVFAHFNCHTVTVTKVLCVFFMFVLLKLVHWMIGQRLVIVICSITVPGLGTGYPVAITWVPGPSFKFNLTK